MHCLRRNCRAVLQYGIGSWLINTRVTVHPIQFFLPLDTQSILVGRRQREARSPGFPVPLGYRSVALVHRSLHCVTSFTLCRAGGLYRTVCAVVEIHSAQRSSESTPPIGATLISEPALGLSRQGPGKLSPEHGSHVFCSLLLVSLASTLLSQCPCR